MRTDIELRRPLGSVPIEDIKLNATPALLVGHQAVYKGEKTRGELFALLNEHILPDRRRRNPGRGWISGQSC